VSGSRAGGGLGGVPRRGRWAARARSRSGQVSLSLTIGSLGPGPPPRSRSLFLPPAPRAPVGAVRRVGREADVYLVRDLKPGRRAGPAPKRRTTSRTCPPRSDVPVLPLAAARVGARGRGAQCQERVSQHGDAYRTRTTLSWYTRMRSPLAGEPANHARRGPCPRRAARCRAPCAR
jgi:hypothetical protein